eukprot:CAMPEP_0114273774 /NCGR_PEP_ID=MMETSP0058-20121206/29329_1 /TAXON_ID=36894 /ORGANISM="Pyramimonas parkeae, CCMP726" /LENGTH=194 /DNA_ID=CAMNT_0001393357 /DNA_START=2171 /DNA_END=2755 /DNA_ORIENTATION=-
MPSILATLTSLITLDLSINELSGTIPKEWATLTNLRYMSLYHNQLVGTVPNELAKLSKLSFMYGPWWDSCKLCQSCVSFGQSLHESLTHNFGQSLHESHHRPYMNESLESFASSLGTVPTSWLWYRDMYRRLVRVAHSFGMVPDSSFIERSLQLACKDLTSQESQIVHMRQQRNIWTRKWKNITQAHASETHMM